MSARIQSAITSKPTVQDASRTDLRAGDVVTLTAIDLAHTTFAWALMFTPDAADGTPSAAVLSATTGSGPITFTVDNEGTYQVRLIVDYGLPTEDSQYVCLRSLTIFGDLTLVSAGERRDSDGTIPVDADATGWADIQNQNLWSLLSFLAPLSTSGRTITVDANRGQDVSNTPNDETIAEGYGDYSTVGDAITAAAALTPVPSATDPVYIRVFPGLYVENLTVPEHVHIVGVESVSYKDTVQAGVTIRTTSGQHEFAPTNASDLCSITNCRLETAVDSTSATVLVSGAGDVMFKNVSILALGNDAANGAALEHTGTGTVYGVDSLIRSEATTLNLLAIECDTANASLELEGCWIQGSSAIDLAATPVTGVSATFRGCRIESLVSNASSFGVRSNAETLVLEHSQVSMTSLGTDAITIHPGGGAFTGSMNNTLRYVTTGDDILIDGTGVTGTQALNFGSVSYSSLAVTGTVTVTATTQAASVFYDNTSSGIAPDDVQSALDYLVGTTTAPAGYVAVNSSPYNLGDDDTFLEVDTSGVAITVNLSSTATGSRENRRLTVKDAGDNAATNNITLQVDSGGSIDSALTLVLNQDGASVSLIANGLTGASAVWYII